MTSFRSRTIGEYLQIIWRRKLLIVLTAIGMLTATFLLIERLPNIYESSATVVISGTQTERQSANSRVAATTERLNSRAFLEPIITRYDPYNSRGNVDSAIAQIRQNVKVDTTYRSDFPERLTIAYRHNDPGIANAVATDLVSAFGNMNEAMEKQAADTAGNLASEIETVENRLRGMGKLRAATAGRQSASGRAAGEMNAVRAQRIAAASSIDTLTDRQFALEQQVNEQKRQIDEQQKIAKLAPSDAKASGSYGVVLVRKAELEAQLKEYGNQYTAKNPKVIQTRTQLAEINHQLAQLNAGGDQTSAPANSAENRELRSMQRELARMQTDLTITNRELERKRSSAPGGAIQATASAPIRIPASIGGTEGGGEIQSDYETLRKRYDVLLNRQDQLERMQIASAGLAPGIFQIVDMPVESRVPVGPNRLKYRVYGLALALGVALLVAFVIEFPKLYSITDDRDVEYYLGVPVIALIPETVAPTAERRSRKLLLGRAVGVVLLTTLTSAVLLLMNYLQVFTQLVALVR
jgi:uncharacterized protein involved in exopolysaccharide biosynthesis